MSIRKSLVLLVLGIGAAGLAAACGDDTYKHDPPPPPTPATPAASPAVNDTAPQPDPPTEFRVAFINLMSPLSLDASNPVATETFELRLEAVIEELRAFDPDIVGFNEVSWTKATGNAAEKLARALKMELQYARANPWFPGQTKSDSDQMMKLAGFDEGELILTKSDYPILRYEPKALNPRTSETEGRAALHVVVKGPGALGEIDVYITHLTGGGEKVRQAQAADFASFIKSTRGTGPVLVMGDLGDGPGTSPPTAITELGLVDIAATVAGDAPIATCCRESVVGEQPPLTGRTDYVFAGGWTIVGAVTFGQTPRKRADGVLVYPSDHNGLEVTFALAAPLP